MGKSHSKQHGSSAISKSTYTTDLDKQIKNDDCCECRFLLLYGYIHEIENLRTLSYIIPNEIYSICESYYITICPKQYFHTFRRNLKEYYTKESLKWSQKW